MSLARSDLFVFRAVGRSNLKSGIAYAYAKYAGFTKMIRIQDYIKVNS